MRGGAGLLTDLTLTLTLTLPLTLTSYATLTQGSGICHRHRQAVRYPVRGLYAKGVACHSWGGSRTMRARALRP